MHTRVLVVDAEIQNQQQLTTILEAQGYTVQTAADGQAAVEAVAVWLPDVVLLDLVLPTLPGIAVCQAIRGWSQVPIIVVSACADEEAKVTALDMGADAYLTRPFGMREFLARIRVALRYGARLRAARELVGQFGSVQINWSRREVTRAGLALRLTPTEYTLLAVLSQHAGKVLTHPILIRAIWGSSGHHDVNTLRVFITQLRRKIEPDPARPTLIMTEPGVGYRFRPADAVVEVAPPRPDGENNR